VSLTGVEGGRAQFAFECAEEGSRLEKKKEYRSYVRKIPALVRSNGLCATIAFAASKKGDSRAWELIYEQMGRWLRQRGLVQGKDLLEKEIVSLSSATYRVATNEVLGLFRWLSWFAEALIEGETNG
jgi:CRISPR-associated protein Cmr5